MKQIIGIFSALVLVPSMQVQAWVGGPWGNDSFQANGDDGVYEAVGTMQDGTAMYRWAVQNSASSGTLFGSVSMDSPGGTSNVQFGGLAGSMSSHVIWYRGLVYHGRCFGMVNSNMETVLCTGNATTNGLDGLQRDLNNVALNPGSSGDITGNFASGSSTTIPDRKNSANSTWRAKLDKYGPMKRFHGAGYIAFVGEPSFDVIIVNTGQVSGNAAINPQVVTVPVTSRSASSQFDPVGHRVKMKVFGTQVSTQVLGL